MKKILCVLYVFGLVLCFGLPGRKCEKFYSGPSTSCQCSEECSIWGDPHIKPFEDDCENIIILGKGNHTLYEIPNTILVEGYVNYNMVKKVFVDGKLFASTDNCRKLSQGTQVLNRTIQNSWGWLVGFGLEVGCVKNKKHRKSYLGIRFLMTHSYGSNSPNTQDILSAVKKSMIHTETDIFPNDAGLCVRDWQEGRVKIKKNRNPNGCVKKGLDGIQCSCVLNCYAYGDPHVGNFFRSSNNDDFMVSSKKNTVLLYEVPNKWTNRAYRAIGITDKKDHIKKLKTYYLIGNTVYTQEYDANAICPTTTEFFVPDIPLGNCGEKDGAPNEISNCAVYDPGRNGFHLGVGDQIDFGSVQIQVRCEKRKNTYFFNLCMERENIGVPPQSLPLTHLERDIMGSQGPCVHDSKTWFGKYMQYSTNQYFDIWPPS